MSLYRQGAGGELPFVVNSRTDSRRARILGPEAYVPPVVIPDKESGFWTLIKWLGAGLTLWVGYEKVKELYDKKLGNTPDDGEGEPAEPVTEE